MVTFKVVSPITGDIKRTSSTSKFRSEGMEFSVKDNLVPGEEPKYEKAVSKKTGNVPVVPQVPEVDNVAHGDVQQPQQPQQVSRVPAPVAKKAPVKRQPKNRIPVVPAQAPQTVEQPKEDGGWWY